MKRNYDEGVKENIKFFVGKEVEKTPAFGMKTLFVTGLQDVSEIQRIADDELCGHIFFGANHSFKPKKLEQWNAWEDMILHFLRNGYLCSLDIDVKLAEEVLEAELIEHNNFIPQIRVPVPYIKQWNYNTMIKLDDRGFDETNPGVWCHSLHDLMDRGKFTDWGKYSLDKIIE